jgi:hypothetical protein
MLPNAILKSNQASFLAQSPFPFARPKKLSKYLLDIPVLMLLSARPLGQ